MMQGEDGIRGAELLSAPRARRSGRTNRPGAAGGRTLPRAAGTSSACSLLGGTDVNQPEELVRSAVPVTAVPVSTVPVWVVRAVWPGHRLAMNAP